MPCLAAQISSTVRTAYENRKPINIIGGGTKSFLGQAFGGGQALHVTGHSGIVDYDPAELVLVARAGTPLKEIEELLLEHHQMLGFEPPFIDAGATLGGAVAAGLAGPRRAYSGAVRDFVLGASFINGKGESVTAGGKVMKNVAGFDLFRPMAGSMGTLGVLLKVALRILPLPETEATVIHEEHDESTALEKMNKWPVKTQAISAASWDGTHIRIRLSGSASGIKHAQSHIGGDLIRESQYWQDLTNFKLDFFRSEGRLWRISVAAMSTPLGDGLNQLIDWGGAQRWLKSDEPAETIRDLAQQKDGHATCFSNDPKIATFHPLKGHLLTINQRFKAALDPAGLLNPGRMHPEF